jgi:hypothetical protein
LSEFRPTADRNIFALQTVSEAEYEVIYANFSKYKLSSSISSAYIEVHVYNPCIDVGMQYMVTDTVRKRLVGVEME